MSRGEPIQGMARLRQVDPPPALVARVMTQVAEPPPPTLWQWLRRPFRIEVRVSPLGAIGLSLGLAVGVALFLAPRAHPRAVSTLRVTAEAGTETGSAPGRADRTVVVRFMLGAPGARHVSVAGSFNDWDPSALPLEDVNANGVFVTTVPLPPGIHEYMFVVDGQWVTDPAASERRPDGFGRQNALLRL